MDALALLVGPTGAPERAHGGRDGEDVAAGGVDMQLTDAPPGAVAIRVALVAGPGMAAGEEQPQHAPTRADFSVVLPSRFLGFHGAQRLRSNS
jgi:hypothetical protein